MLTHIMNNCIVIVKKEILKNIIFNNINKIFQFSKIVCYKQ